MGLSPAFGAWQAPPVPPLEGFSETRLLPPLVIGEEEIADCVERLRAALA